MADEKVTVVKDGGGGSVVAIIVGVIALLVVLYVLFGTNLLQGTPEKIDIDAKIETPK